MHPSTFFSGLFCFVILTQCCRGIAAESGPKVARGPRDWAKVDDQYWAEVEKQWGVEGEDEATREESKRLVAEMESRVGRGGVGSTMMHLTLDGTLSRKETDEAADVLRALLLTGGVEAQFYQLRPGELLLTLKKGWEGRDVYAFLQERSEIRKVQWDDKARLEEL